VSDVDMTSSVEPLAEEPPARMGGSMVLLAATVFLSSFLLF
jgi:hypothetical protein